MFGKLKQYAMKKMLQSQLKNVPEDQQQMIMEMIEKDPKLFEKIATEMQAELKANGNNQMAAATKVLPKYQKEIMAVMSPEMKEKLMQMQGAAAAGQFNPDGSIRN
jgi:head-tail adaptor